MSDFKRIFNSLSNPANLYISPLPPLVVKKDFKSILAIYSLLTMTNLGLKVNLETTTIEGGNNETIG
jgi:hypothetical protein